MDNATLWIRDDKNWIWNYLTIHAYIERFSILKCNICNRIFKLKNKHYDDNTKRAMKEHIFSTHNNIFTMCNDIFSDKSKSSTYSRWSLKYTKENLKQVKCKYCEFRINFSMVLEGTKQLIEHMSREHEVTDGTNLLLENYLRTKVKDYYELNEYAQEQYCKKCSQSQKSDFIILLKHLINTHHHDVPAYMIPKGLQNSSASIPSGNIGELLDDYEIGDNFEDIPDDGSIDLTEIQISEYLSRNQPSSDPIDTSSTNQGQPSVQREDIQNPSSDPIDTPTTNRGQPSVQRENIQNPSPDPIDTPSTNQGQPSVQCEDIQNPSSDPIDTPSTSQGQTSIKRNISSSTSTEEPKSKKKKNPKDNSNNKEDD